MGDKIWKTLLIICGLILVIIIKWSINQPDLKVKIDTIKQQYDDYSVFWIENEEAVTIELTEVEINNEYKLRKFPSDEDYGNPDIIGLGKQFIKPGERVMFFTKYFHNSDGKKFDSHSLVFTDILIWAEFEGNVRTAYFMFRK